MGLVSQYDIEYNLIYHRCHKDDHIWPEIPVIFPVRKYQRKKDQIDQKEVNIIGCIRLQTKKGRAYSSYNRSQK